MTQKGADAAMAGSRHTEAGETCADAENTRSPGGGRLNAVSPDGTVRNGLAVRPMATLNRDVNVESGPIARAGRTDL
jgi:hypothetical protein